MVNAHCPFLIHVITYTIDHREGIKGCDEGETKTQSSLNGGFSIWAQPSKNNGEIRGVTPLLSVFTKKTLMRLDT